MNKDLRTIVSNVLVIGSGAAGLRSAIAAAQFGKDVMVVGKRMRKDVHTVLASGGINAAFGNVDPEDSWQQHFADTIKEAYYLSNPRMVEIMAQEALTTVDELTEWGCDFARTPDDKLDQRYYGAHKYRRTCYAGDYTGREILYALNFQVSQLKIPIHERQYVSKLLVKDGACFGAMAFDIDTGERTVYLADAVILATGGHTRIWRRSSSRPEENTGDGMALALKAGCSLADMEMVQFHPTGMVAPEGWIGALVTEAVRGEGGILLNILGERFMSRYDPERMELSTHDRIAIAIYVEIMEGRGTPDGGVYLDIRHISKSIILEKLPRMYRQFQESQMIDISLQKMEVAPTAHYSMGGVVVNPETTATEILGLYAAGEVTSGLHGANRLGGNSLTETLVFGRRAGKAAAAYSSAIPSPLRSDREIQAANQELDSLIRDGDTLARPLQNTLQNIMWETCGVIRNQNSMKQGLEKLTEIKDQLPYLDVKPKSEGYRDLTAALDLISSLVTSEATLLSALERRESRGAHLRSDYPKSDPDLIVNYIVDQDTRGKLSVSCKEVPKLPEELLGWLSQKDVLDMKNRLLE